MTRIRGVVVEIEEGRFGDGVVGRSGNISVTGGWIGMVSGSI
jgi:hypothetical protein